MAPLTSAGGRAGVVLLLVPFARVGVGLDAAVEVVGGLVVVVHALLDGRIGRDD